MTRVTAWFWVGSSYFGPQELHVARESQAQRYGLSWAAVVPAPPPQRPPQGAFEGMATASMGGAQAALPAWHAHVTAPVGATSQDSVHPIPGQHSSLCRPGNMPGAVHAAQSVQVHLAAVVIILSHLGGVFSFDRALHSLPMPEGWPCPFTGPAPPAHPPPAMHQPISVPPAGTNTGLLPPQPAPCAPKQPEAPLPPPSAAAVITLSAKPTEASSDTRAPLKRPRSPSPSLSPPKRTKPLTAAGSAANAGGPHDPSDVPAGTSQHDLPDAATAGTAAAAALSQSTEDLTTWQAPTSWSGGSISGTSQNNTGRGG